jgi:anti-anti-sigma factor
VEGEESAALQREFVDTLSIDPRVVLDLGGVDYIDSSGLGLLVRFLNRSRAASGGLKLCAVPARVVEVLRITNLAPIFESFASEAEAVAAFYQSASEAETPFRFHTSILCIDRSANVLAGMREVLGQAGYGAMSADNLPDALILMQATRPALVVIGAAIHRAAGAPGMDRFKKLLEGIAVIELPEDFASQDAGEANRKLVEQVRAALTRPKAS